MEKSIQCSESCLFEDQVWGQASPSYALTLGIEIQKLP